MPGSGGLLGVLFTIPLRRALIVEDPLRYPEGVATAEVLKAGDSGGAEVKYLAVSGAVGAAFKLGGLGFRLWPEQIELARHVAGTVAYVGSNLSPALVGVGYIVGLNVVVLVFLGGVLNWWVAIPVLVASGQGPEGLAVDVAGTLWSTQTRFLGVGAMVVGGLWALVRLRHSLVTGVQSGVEAVRRARDGTARAVVRTERDAPMPWVGAAIAVSVVPLFLIFEYFTGNLLVSALMAVIMLVAGFLFSAVAGYMAGLVGSSNNPISGVTIATLLFSALLLLVLLGADDPTGPASAIFIAAVVACAAAIAGDNLQDLKAGRLVGATPVRQQIMQGVGVLSAAVVMAPILTLLLAAYGIGQVTPEHPSPLAAPQATLMASVAGGVFGGDLPWRMVWIGMAVAVGVIVIDLWLERRDISFRAPVLAVAVGIYLPLELEVPMLLGGLLAWGGSRSLARRLEVQAPATGEPPAVARATGERRGLLFAAGLITGEALVGILMAIPIVAAGDAEVLALGVPPEAWLGLLLLLVVAVGLYRVTLGPALARRAANDRG